MAIVLRKAKRKPKIKPLEWIHKFTFVRDGVRAARAKWIAEGGNYTIKQIARYDEYQLIIGSGNETIYFSGFGSYAVETLMLVAEKYHQEELDISEDPL